MFKIKSTKNLNRIYGILALLVVGSALGYISYGGIEKNLVYFWDVDELLKQGKKAYNASVRLGGVVVPNTYKWDEKSLELRFQMASNNIQNAKKIVVHSTGTPPQMFRESIGVVVEGTYNGQFFHADRVIVKHSNEYSPPKENEKPKNVYQTLLDDS